MDAITVGGTAARPRNRMVVTSSDVGHFREDLKFSLWRINWMIHFGDNANSNCGQKLTRATFPVPFAVFAVTPTFLCGGTGGLYSTAFAETPCGGSGGAIAADWSLKMTLDRFRTYTGG